MNINNYATVERHNRPNVLQKVALVNYFINDGVYYDPYSVSTVSIYRRQDKDLSSLTTDTGQLSASPLMNFSGNLDASDYSPGAAATKIYKLGTGIYAAILDGGVTLVGSWMGNSITNQVSTIGDYVDAWSVQYTSNSVLNVVYNEFSLFDDTFFSITEPLQIKTYNRLLTQKIVLGSKVNLKILTDVYVENRTIDDSVKNLFQDSLLTSAAVQITKINEDSNLAARVVVSSFAGTSALTQVSPDNTIILSFDTNTLLPLVTTIGNQRGEYRVQARYTILDETIYTPEFSVWIR